jgi:tripartite-type tricarboxylate transporter receptor subunit TctC
MKTGIGWVVFALFVALFSASPDGVIAAEKEYPNRPIEMVVVMPPGGPTDVAARIIQPPLQSILGVPIIISNKGGGGGALGAEYVAKSKPDGYTILAHTNATLDMVPVLNPAVSYKYTDFTPICFYAVDPVLICSKPDAPWKNADELVAYAKKNPGKLNYASSGLGTASYFVMEAFKISNGIDIVPVHFQGSGPAKTAILGGHVDLAALGLGALISVIKAGSVIPILTTAEKRMPLLDRVPTMVEKGIPEASMSIWMGLSVPASSPKAIVDKLAQAMEKVMKDPATANRLEKAAMAAVYKSGPESFMLMANELKTVEKLSKKMGIVK